VSLGAPLRESSTMGLVHRCAQLCVVGIVELDPVATPEARLSEPTFWVAVKGAAA
jgi:hypothetical protein